jgi:hypothetical protein
MTIYEFKINKVIYYRHSTSKMLPSLTLYFNLNFYQILFECVHDIESENRVNFDKKKQKTIQNATSMLATIPLVTNCLTFFSLHLSFAIVRPLINGFWSHEQQEKEKYIFYDISLMPRWSHPIFLGARFFCAIRCAKRDQIFIDGRWTHDGRGSSNIMMVWDDIDGDYCLKKTRW